MDVAKGSALEPMLTTAELAAREDFCLGETLVSPSTRIVRGPDGSADVEPRVMQVLVVLADAAGQVVTRDTLFSRCWGGVYVGDDSLNRAVAGVRRVASDVGKGSFEVETIPRTGYRLTGAIVRPPGRDDATFLAGSSRRSFVAAGLVLASAAAGFGLWSAIGPPTDPRFQAVMKRGDEAIRTGFLEDPGLAGLYERAVQLEPGSARAWGLLSYFKSRSIDHTQTADPGRVAEEAEAALRRALTIDPNEPNARTALVMLRGSTLDWATRDRSLRDVLATDDHNIPATTELMALLQAAGLTRESWNWNERILAPKEYLILHENSLF